MCENLINALKLLANQQKDGDSPIQSIVIGLCERCRKGIMEPEKQKRVDKHCALGVGHLQEGTQSFRGTNAEVRRMVPRGVNQGRCRGIDASEP